MDFVKIIELRRAPLKRTKRSLNRLIWCEWLNKTLTLGEMLSLNKEQGTPDLPTRRVVIKHIENENDLH
jgi:hypothetical protein